VSRYRKKPVEIEARSFIPEQADDVAAWCGGRVRRVPKPSDHSDVAIFLDIPTLEGTMTANAGDWIIRGVQGEFYPCKPDIFVATYEPVAAGVGEPE
jgi:hypothetical protein